MGTKWNGLNRNNPPAKTTKEVLDRNKEWKKRVLTRAQYLFQKYGYIPDEYTGESIRIMSTVPKTGEEGWAHHIDSDRNNLDKSNIFICKYKTHHLIEIGHIAVRQEGFQGAAPDNIPRPQSIQVEEM